MIVSRNHLLTEIYTEHMVETGVLVSTMMEYFYDSEIQWIDSSEIEERINPHIHALQIAYPLADDIIKILLSSIDSDEMLGSLMIAAEINPSNYLNYFSEINFDDVDDEVLSIYAQALKLVKNTQISNYLLSLLKNNDPKIRATVLEVIAYRGDVDPHRIWPFFNDKEESVRLAAMVAAMRLGFKKAVPAMEHAVLENKELFNEHCVFPLLMLGSHKALKFSRLACQSASYIKPQYPIYLALAGNKEDINYILKALEFENMALSVLEALGIYGSLGGVNTLMKFLSSKDDEEKLTAAKSLNQISGAQLFEIVTATEKEDDDLDPEDITGKPAASGDGKKEGDEKTIEIKQNCIDKDRWLQWWQENKTRFDPNVRYRHGKPYSYFLVLEEIAHPASLLEDRQRAYHELVMRTGHHIPFEPDWFVSKQIEALKKWQVWWNGHKAEYINPWLFDGK